jgi:PsbN protein
VLATLRETPVPYEGLSRVVTEIRSTPADAPLPPQAMDPSLTSTSPAFSVALTVLAVLLALTGFGIYQAFGPPSKSLTDPFDDHED